MNNMIYKYQIYPGGFTELLLPPGAKPLCVQVQKEVPYLWCLVDPTPRDTLEARKFVTVLTGEARDELDAATYIGTFQLSGGGFVGHTFETKDAG